VTDMDVISVVVVVPVTGAFFKLSASWADDVVYSL
jgi:hypothetical protein